MDHVTRYQIPGTGLLVEGSAGNSGPYSNITFDTGSYSSASSTVCAQIISVSGSTKGIQHLTCISESNTPQAAVLLDSSNNLIKDVRIAGLLRWDSRGRECQRDGDCVTRVVSP